jgi:hypothetical protein
MNEAASDARKKATSAISLGLAVRPKGWNFNTSCLLADAAFQGWRIWKREIHPEDSQLTDAPIAPSVDPPKREQ